MKRQDIIDELQKSDDVAKQIGLPKAEHLCFLIKRKTPPTGYKIRTPFGLCDIMNCQEKPDGYQTVFRASRKQIESLIKRLDK